MGGERREDGREKRLLGQVVLKTSSFGVTPLHHAAVPGKETGRTSPGRQAGKALHRAGKRTLHTVPQMPPHDRPRTVPVPLGVWSGRSLH